MMTPQVCGENPENYDSHKVLLSVKHYDKKTKKSFYKIEPLSFRTRKCIPAYQSIKMNEEAYDYMTSIACPEWYPLGISKWKKLSPQERLELHLERTCKALNGKSYTYIVFGD
jgi:hypothetical protein